LLIFPIALAVAVPAGRASVSGRRILAVLFGSFIGYGVAISVNAVLTSVMTWHPVNGAAAYTGDIMTGLMIAGSGLGLLAALFIRDSSTNRLHRDQPEPGKHAVADELADR
jgi:hypothetical protein